MRNLKRGKATAAVPAGAVRQHWSLIILSGFCLVAGGVLGGVGVVGLFSDVDTNSNAMPMGAAIASVVSGLGVVAVGVWAWAYYRFSYVAIEPTQVVQRTASKRIKRIPYREIVEVEEIIVHNSRQVKITGSDGTVIQTDSDGLDILAIRRKAPRHGRPGKTSSESKDRRRSRQQRK
ncbi:hypothetical protein V5R04_08885 [Jonesiaceae bacterium BS-20]|uniref:DUF304 domain-containing protein n=1 Tax=Jonesiaceae bacterium BS-20 TaxID=3120821 RepID=A0AAU7DRQ5_9MICO